MGQSISHIDAKSGYWMACLNRESSLLMTFKTPWGKYRWLWLPFSLSIHSDIFKERLSTVIKMVSGITAIADDVLARWYDKTSHDVAFISLLKTAWSNNLKFKPDKIQFKMKLFKFFGQLLNQEDMGNDRRKLMPSGKWMHCSLRRNWRVSRVWQTITKSILQQTDTSVRSIEGTPEKWQTMVLGIQTPGGIRFEAIKEELTKSPVLIFYPKEDHVIQVDRSMKDLGAVLLQKGRPVIYMSRMLMAAETETPTLKVSYSASYSGRKGYITMSLAARSRYRLTTSHWYQSGRSQLWQPALNFNDYCSNWQNMMWNWHIWRAKTILLQMLSAASANWNQRQWTKMTLM